MLPRLSKMRDQVELSDPTVTLMVISETGYVSTYTDDRRAKATFLKDQVLRPGDLVLALVNEPGRQRPPRVIVVDDHTELRERFGMKPTDITMTAIHDAKRQAWRACAEASCPRCGVEAWQYCRNEVKGVAYTTRFHRARQDASGATEILAAVDMVRRGWQPGVGRHAWTAQRLSET